MVRSRAENAGRSFWADWARVRCPTLLVVARSGLLPPEEVEQMTARRPETVAVSVPERVMICIWRGRTP